jgi:hypothetical protein
MQLLKSKFSTALSTLASIVTCVQLPGGRISPRLKADLGTSVADHTYAIQSFDRTITHLHDPMQQALDLEHGTNEQAC